MENIFPPALSAALEALGSRVAQRALTVLILDGDVVLEDVAAALGVDEGEAGRVLGRLVSAGLAESHVVGGRVFYRASPLAVRLVAAVLSTVSAE